MIEDPNEIPPQDATDKEASGGRSPSPCCVSFSLSLPVTPWVIHMMEDAAKLALNAGDNFVRIHHVAAVIGKGPPPSKIEPPKPKRRIVIATKPCPKCGEQLRKFQRHKADCKGPHNAIAQTPPESGTKNL